MLETGNRVIWKEELTHTQSRVLEPPPELGTAESYNLGVSIMETQKGRTLDSWILSVMLLGLRPKRTSLGTSGFQRCLAQRAKSNGSLSVHLRRHHRLDFLTVASLVAFLSSSSLSLTKTFLFPIL